MYFMKIDLMSFMNIGLAKDERIKELRRMLKA